MQIFARLWDLRRVTIAQPLYRALGLVEGDWLRITVLDDRRAVIKRIPDKPADVTDLPPQHRP